MKLVSILRISLDHDIKPIFFNVVQVQLSPFPPPSQPSPSPTLTPTSLWFCPCVFYRCSWKPFPFFTSITSSHLPSCYCQFVLNFNVLEIPLLGLYPKNPETPIQNNLCTMFIAAQFTIAKYWKQPKCPPVNEWIKKLWYIYTMEYYAAEIKEPLTLPQHGWNWRALC